jgi:hypothetical protein
MKVRRWLYLTHRWLGVALCLLVAMWLFSGVVMMYVGFPNLEQQERLASLPVLEAESVAVAPNALLEQIDGSAVIDDFRLTSVLGRPVWLLRTSDGATKGLFADTGEAVAQSVTAADALLAAQLYVDNVGIETSTGVTFLTRLEMDQWSVSSALHPHRPLYLVALNDAEDTQLYISSHIAEVVRDTNASERVWNWLGANLHWIYPLQLRRHPTVWHWVVVVLSLAGIVSIITGAIVGIVRLRLRKPYRGTDVTPYRGAMKLHHILGLCVLLPLSTFMFSGLMSMNPWGVFNDDIPYSDHYTAYRGSPTVAVALTQSPTIAALRKALASHRDSREVVWQWLGGKPYQYSISGNNQRQSFTPSAPTGIRDREKGWEHAGVARLQEVMAGHAISASETLDAYDSYYYSHHDSWRPLPALRVRFDDPAQTWFHVDLATGELLNRLTVTGRLQRWLYNGLHSLDFIVLIRNRPLWDVVVIALSIAGFVFALTSVVVGWRRLRPAPGLRPGNRRKERQMAASRIYFPNMSNKL